MANKKYTYDYIIIGSGAAGATVALSLASPKRKVAIVEGDIFGGSNLVTRDVPYAISLSFAHNYSNMHNFPEINHRELHFNFPTVVAHQNYIISTMLDQSKQSLKDAGVTLIPGRAHFLDAHTIGIEEKQFTASRFIIASGAQPKTNGIIGTDTVKYFTPDNIIKARRLPKFLLVVGGGPSGCEIAEYFAELGSKVIIVEQKDRLLPREDKEAGATLAEYFTRRLGIIVATNAEVVAIEQDSVSKKVIFKIGEQEKNIRIDHIVLATGSAPNTDLGLENANVKFKDTGILVNRAFQTTAKNIFAIGDCIGGESSTEIAEYQASLLASTLLNKSKGIANYNGFVRTVNTLPEIATVGYNKVDLAKLKRRCRKAIVYLKDTPANNIYNFNYGFVKILADHSGHILGATIAAPNATLMAEEFAIAIRHNLTVLELASTPHKTNGFDQAIKLAARQLIKQK